MTNHNRILISILDYHQTGYYNSALEQYYLNAGGHQETITASDDALVTVDNLPFKVPSVRIPNLCILTLNFSNRPHQTRMRFTVVLSDEAFDIIRRQENDHIVDTNEYNNLMEALFNELFAKGFHSVYDLDTCDILMNNYESISHCIVRGYVYMQKRNSYAIQYVRP